MLEDNGGFLCRPVLIAIVAGIAARIVIGTLLSFPDDIQSWALTISNFQAGGGLYELAGYNYTPIWGYVLGTIDLLGEGFGIDVFGTRLIETLPIENGDSVACTLVPSLAFCLMFKIGLFLCDLGVAYLVWWIVMDRTDDGNKAATAFALSFLCPLVITASGAQGMFDTVGALLTLLCVVMLMRGRLYLAGACFSCAVLTKIFPGFLIFVLVAYVLATRDDRHAALMDVVKAVAGAAIALIVVMMPTVLDGTFEYSISALTSRTSSMGGSIGGLLSAATMIAYAAILVASALLGRHMYRSEGDRDGLLLKMLMINIATIFLFPANAQYIVLLMPFLIIEYITADEGYKVPLIVLIVGTTIFSLTDLPTDLLPLAGSTGIIGVDTVAGWIQSYVDPIVGSISMKTIVSSTGAIEYLGIVLILWRTYDRNRNRQTVRYRAL